ncbi:MAG: 4Fe-4S binding protein [Elusimicrobia bacterium]|nr:4Fe-4S binding protein [Candidatus Liberimonas magnetica]
MCEFCQKHGEGKKWYLNIKNYSHDLLSDIRRKEFIHTFYHKVIGRGHNELTKLEKLFNGKKAPKFLASRFIKKNKDIHYGQVIPLEDVRSIFEMSSSISRIACGCRWASKKKEERCCFGITLNPALWYEEFDMDYFGSPDLSKHESMTVEQAMETVSRYDAQGLIHSVWTFMTPFIGGICNCGLEDCLAMRSTHGLGLSSLFRSEYIAQVDQLKCIGCLKCEKLCPVKAIDHIALENKCKVDKTKCFGCGVCRAMCPASSISLIDRSSDPVSANLW